MRTGKQLLLALAVLIGFGSVDMVMAEDNASAPAAGSQASPEKKPTRTRRLGKRLRKLGGRLHKKKAPAADASGTDAAPAAGK